MKQVIIPLLSRQNSCLWNPPTYSYSYSYSYSYYAQGLFSLREILQKPPRMSEEEYANIIQYLAHQKNQYLSNTIKEVRKKALYYYHSYYYYANPQIIIIIIMLISKRVTRKKEVSRFTTNKTSHWNYLFLYLHYNYSELYTQKDGFMVTVTWETLCTVMEGFLQLILREVLPPPIKSNSSWTFKKHLDISQVLLYTLSTS